MCILSQIYANFLWFENSELQSASKPRHIPTMYWRREPIISCNPLMGNNKSKHQGKTNTALCKEEKLRSYRFLKNCPVLRKYPACSDKLPKWEKWSLPRKSHGLRLSMFLAVSSISAFFGPISYFGLVSCQSKLVERRRFSNSNWFQYPLFLPLFVFWSSLFLLWFWTWS